MPLAYLQQVPKSCRFRAVERHVGTHSSNMPALSTCLAMSDARRQAVLRAPYPLNDSRHPRVFQYPDAPGTIRPDRGKARRDCGHGSVRDRGIETAAKHSRGDSGRVCQGSRRYPAHAPEERNPVVCTREEVATRRRPDHHRPGTGSLDLLHGHRVGQWMASDKIFRAPCVNCSMALERFVGCPRLARGDGHRCSFIQI